MGHKFETLGNAILQVFEDDQPILATDPGWKEQSTLAGLDHAPAIIAAPNLRFGSLDSGTTSLAADRFSLGSMGARLAIRMSNRIVRSRRQAWT